MRVLEGPGGRGAILPGLRAQVVVETRTGGHRLGVEVSGERAVLYEKRQFQLMKTSVSDWQLLFRTAAHPCARYHSSLENASADVGALMCERRLSGLSGSTPFRLDHNENTPAWRRAFRLWWSLTDSFDFKGLGASSDAVLRDYLNRLFF